MSKTYSAGIVTAYGSAKRAGYTGTYEDFCRQQAQYADNASAVEQAKQTAVSASQSADQAKQDAQTASTTAQQSAQSAQGSAQSAGQSAVDAQTAKNNAQTYAQSASQSAGSAQQSAQSAQAVLESIPEDYSDLSENVDKLKADLDDNVSALNHNLIGNNLIGKEVNVYYPTFIPAGKKVTWSYAGGSELVVNSVSFYFYDRNKTQIASYGIASVAETTKRTVTISSTIDTCYVRMTGSPADDVMMNFGSDVIEYEPYVIKNTELFEQLSKIDDILHKETRFAIAAGASHSSTLNRLAFQLSSGEEYYVYIKSAVRSYLELFEYDGVTNKSRGRKNTNTLLKLEASGDATHLGLFSAAASSDDDITIYAFKAESFDALFVANKMEETAQRVEEIATTTQSLRDGFGHVSFHVNAGSSHSSLIDKISMNLAEGEDFYVIADGFGDRNANVRISSSSPSYLVKDGFFNKFRANATTDYIGLYLGNGSEDVDVNLTVVKPSSAFAQFMRLSDYDSEFKTKLLNANRKANSGNYNNLTSPEIFTIAHFSDIHGNIFAIKQMQMFKDTFKKYIDDMICTGDVVADKLSDGTAFWDNSDGSILICIGNHDSLGADGWSNPVSQQTLYDTYISPYESKWNALIVSGHSYWYKDYADKKIRLIAVDGTIFDATEQAAQMNWLTATLSDANANGYAVIGAVHFPPMPSTFHKIESNFSALLHDTAGDMSQFAWSKYNGDILQAVDDFIDAGGNFVCWLSGHTHYDNVSYDTRFPRQLFVTISCALPNGMFDERMRSSEYYKTGILLNTVSVDLVRKYIKLLRYGAEWDDVLRHQGSCVIEYGSNPPRILHQN